MRGRGPGGDRRRLFAFARLPGRRALPASPDPGQSAGYRRHGVSGRAADGAARRFDQAADRASHGLRDPGRSRAGLDGHTDRRCEPRLLKPHGGSDVGCLATRRAVCRHAAGPGRIRHAAPGSRCPDHAVADVSVSGRLSTGATPKVTAAPTRTVGLLNG